MRHAALLLTAAVLLTACVARPVPGPAPAPPPQPPPLTYVRERAVFQLYNSCSMCRPLRVTEAVPQFTLWGDGRLVFAAADGSLYTARLDPSAADRLVQQAAFLYELENHYQALAATDLPGTTFTLATDRGRKHVLIAGYSPSARGDEPHHAVFEGLRALERAALALVPPAGEPYQPEAVLVRYWDEGEGVATQEWPADLTGALQGEQARRAVQLSGPGPARYWRLQDKVQRVLVLPVLPTAGAWEPDLPDPAAGRVLAVVRQLDPNAPWAIAGFMPEYVDDSEGQRRKRPAWLVDAVYPAGNRTVVWVDARTFEAFRVMPAEAPGAP